MFELSYYPIQDSWFYLLVAFILEALAGYVWQYRKSKGALPLVAGLLLRAVWLLSLVGIATAADLESKLWGVTVQQMAAAWPAVLWLVFLLQLTNREQWLNNRTLTALLLVPALTNLLLFTNAWHSLYWREISLAGNVLTVSRGVGNWLMIAYNYALIFPILYISFRWIRQCTGLRRRQAILVTLAPVCGGIGATIWIFMHHTGLFSPLPLSSLITGLLWTYGFFYLKVIKLMPLAQAKAVEAVGTGLVVIDNDGWVVEVNSAAATLLALEVGQLEGKQAAVAFAKWPALAALVQTDHAAMQEICLAQEACSRCYEVHMVRLADRSGRLGKALVWKEITEQKRAQEQLIEQAKALSILSERNRIRRDFHDGPAQLGGYLQLELQTILVLLDKERLADAKTHVKRLLELAKEFNTEVRDTIADLKTGCSSAQDFFQLLQDYLDRYQINYGIRTALTYSPRLSDKLFSHMTGLQLMWIVQEALNNVRKHAQAENVLVKIDVSGARAVITIADDGQGFDLSARAIGKNHYGLAIMRERAAEAGGAVRFDSRLGAGAKVIVEIPLEKVAQDEGIVS